eukprot:760380-Hanusia_phi.AAC.2
MLRRFSSAAVRGSMVSISSTPMAPRPVSRLTKVASSSRSNLTSRPQTYPTMLCSEGVQSRALSMSGRVKATSSVPHMRDRVVRVTFSNNLGERCQVVAYHGQTLYEVAIKNKVQVGDLLTCHVIFAPDTFEAYPKPLAEELELLETFPEKSPTSRMASFVRLDSGLPDPVVALGKIEPTDIP